MFDYILFPKYVYEAKKGSANDNFHSIGNKYLPLSDESSKKVDDLVNSSIDLSDHELDIVNSYIPQYFISLKFKSLLQNLKLISPNFTISAIIFICNIYQIWFCDVDDTDTGSNDEFSSINKSITTNFKKLGTSKKSPQDDELFQLTQVIYYLHMFKVMRFSECVGDVLDATINILSKYDLFYEYSTVYMLVLVLTKPFNKLQVDEKLVEYNPQLVLLCNKLSIGDFHYTISVDESKFGYLMPISINKPFMNYLNETISFKIFLSVMKFTSKISTTDMKSIMDHYDHEKLVMLIYVLNLHEVGIGYNETEGYFYNTPPSSTDTKKLASGLARLNQMVENETTSTLLNNELISKFNHN